MLRGGAFAGESYWSSACATWPLGSLTISSSRLKLSLGSLALFEYKFEIPKEAIRKLVFVESNFLFSPSVPTGTLEIHHRLSGVPSYLRFGTFAPEKVKSVLKAAGFEFLTKRSRFFGGSTESRPTD